MDIELKHDYWAKLYCNEWSCDTMGQYFDVMDWGHYDKEGYIKGELDDLPF